MHDPQILAFDVKYPWYRYRPWPKRYRHSGDRKFTWRRMTDEEKQGRNSFWEEGYRDTFIQIWHVDPEKDGSDDSCGWSWPKLTKRQKERLKNSAWTEGHNPHFLRELGKSWTGTVADAESLYRGLVAFVVRILRLKFTYDEICRYACEAIHVSVDVGKIGDTYCFLPGWHTNFENDSKEHREDHFYGILCSVARGLLDMKRPWWKHPKWHFWHWKIQCVPLMSFKRWAFSRCCKCGKGFSWGYAPTTNSWYGTGPRWFRSERDVFHSDCNHPTDSCLSASEPSTSNAT